MIKMLRLIEKFRVLDAEMQMQTAAVFALVAVRSSITMKEIGARLNLSQSSCSRNVAALSGWHRLDRVGHGLVETINDPAERRRKIVRLTAEGARMAAMLAELLNEDKPSVRVTSGMDGALG